MRRANVLFRSTARRLRQRGSALLASLMVIVGLSLLGLAFVAISETESSIANNQKNHSEAVAVAEAGGKLVVQWFQDPDKMARLGLLPTNLNNNLKTQRTVFSQQSYYKQDFSQKLCDLPFGPKDPDEFFGLEDSADVIIDRNTNDGKAFLDAFNTKAFGAEGTVDPRPAGEVTMIKIFAPPIVGATVTAPNAPHFYEGGTRYGVATIMVRAEKFDHPLSAGAANRHSLALSECRIVVSQFPTPQPGGPLQSSTALATNGNFNVHWGLVSSQQSLDLKKDYTAMPWFNAWEPINFQRGYDSSVEWTANTPYVVGDIVRPTQAKMAANNLLRFHEYTVTVAGTSGTNEPAWLTTPAGVTVTLDGVTYAERPPTAYPLSMGGSPNPTNTPWLYYIASGNVSVEDPWFHARAAQDVVSAGNPSGSPPNSNPQPWSFFPWTGTPDPRTHVFQFQSLNQYPDFKQLVFPIFNYDYWKAAAIAGNGQSGATGGGVHYLEWVAADTYTDGIDTKTFRDWVASTTSQPGFYFFETQNKLNPQNGGPGILAPEVQVNGGNVDAYMSSFVYLNAKFSTTGLGGITGHFNQPGEPYLDIGYRQVDETSATGDFVRDASGMPVVKMAANRQWDFQDLAWSNTGSTGAGGGTKNGAFDVCVGPRTVANPAGGTYTGFFPIPYRPGCKPGNNIDLPNCNCSEPHEPYLNIQYNGSTSGITFGWFDPATAVSTMRRPKKTSGGRTGTPVTCTSTSSQDDCTSNAYDLDGGLADLTPVSDGVLYMEGDFDSKGNADYYGAVLVGGQVQSQGTPTIWYDESLSRGIRLSGFPRVMITSLETDR